MYQESQASSSQDSSPIGTSILSTIGRIRDTIAFYTGFGSQSPPSSPTISPHALDNVSSPMSMLTPYADSLVFAKHQLVPALAAATSLKASNSSKFLIFFTALLHFSQSLP